MIKIVTDSTCDLPPAWLEQHQVTVVPMHIQFGLETFSEGQNITPEDFYRRIEASGTLPTTSQATAGEFDQVYRDLSTADDEILSVHLTSKLSGTWQSASMIARQWPDSHIRVVDSWSGSVGLGLIVRDAVQLAQTGLPLNEIAALLEARRRHIHVFILLKDLRYARMSGRVGRVQEMLASLLNVKPIIGVDEGALTSLERVRSQRKGFERMVALAVEQVGDTPIQLGLSHALAPAEAAELLTLAQSHLNCQDTFIADMAVSLAVHFGPGSVGFATYPA